MRLASRGGRSLTSTKLWLLGGQITIRGLAPAPFFISTIRFPECGRRVPAKVRYAARYRCAKKVSGRWGFRPLWRGGWRELHSEDQSFSGRAGRSTALASRRTTHRSKIPITIVSAAPGTELNSRSLFTFWRRPLIRSLGWKVQL